ncbi:MAG TPA: hypothetical protein VFQ81_11785 [Candidatus Limnocylindria bacterium]|nr:hypothetical protein [Candidatus Limnocylindria bacterium]
MSLGIALLITACIGSASLARFRNSEFQLLAGAHGTLELEDGCFRLRMPGGATYNLYWASDAVVNGDGSTVTLNGVTATVGESVMVGGGEMNVDRETVASFDWVEAPAERCIHGPDWFVWQLPT